MIFIWKMQLLRQQIQIHIIRHSNIQTGNLTTAIYNTRKLGIIEYVFFREDAGTYTCRARVPQTGLKPNDEPNDDDDNDDDNG